MFQSEGAEEDTEREEDNCMQELREGEGKTSMRVATKGGTVPVPVLLSVPGRFGSIFSVLRFFTVLNPYSKWPCDSYLANGNQNCKAR